MNQPSDPAPDGTIKTVTFIQYDVPNLKAGEYTVSGTQTVNQATPNSFPATRSFAVAGNRFQLAGDDVVSTFPPNLANGEFDGVLPHVVLKRSSLPWQRNSVPDELNAPWLAVLLFEANQMPPVQTGVAADLIAAGATITVWGSTTTGTGTMSAGTLSYPGIDKLDYGQSPSDVCSFIDLPVATFSQIAPTAADLPYLAHIRETDTLDGVDHPDLIQDFAVVLGNRIPADQAEAYAALVSLENMGALLPDDSGAPSPNIPPGTTTIRLLVYTTWRFFVNDLDQSFQSLAENLNRNSSGQLGFTSLRVAAPATTAGAVAQAISDEATTLTGADADALVLNALAAGYVPLDHHLREAGNTVSWFRGPLLPYGSDSTFVDLPAQGPDALLRYDPQTGMFDTSYAAAWQLGQLLALQSAGYASALYEWKQTLAKGVAAQEEQALLQQKLGNGAVFPSFMASRSLALDALPPIPDVVSAFIGQLRLLAGVPFSSLVPDELMLPPESFRLFAVDPNWIAALVDGAFSIGRATSADATADATKIASVHVASSSYARAARTNDRPQLAALKAAPASVALEVVTGVLLRSELVSGWPQLNLNGYSDTAGTHELPKLRMVRLSNSVTLCLFDGTVQLVTIHEAPEQLHCGVELAGAAASTTLRAVSGPNPGAQYLTDPEGGPASASVPLRADGQTLCVADAAASVLNKLTTDFSQTIPSFTSAEFALQFIKGVVKVNYVIGD